MVQRQHGVERDTAEQIAFAVGNVNVARWMIAQPPFKDEIASADFPHIRFSTDGSTMSSARTAVRGWRFSDLGSTSGLAVRHAEFKGGFVGVVQHGAQHLVARQMFHILINGVLPCPDFP
jgi:hypothetical protein